MPSHSRPDGLLRPDADDVNARIRRLMDEPAGERRSQEYVRLLPLWAEVTRPDFVEAA